jgi:hypothetical protein
MATLAVDRLSVSPTSSATFRDVVLPSLVALAAAEAEDATYLHALVQLFQVAAKELSVTTCRYEVDGVAVELHDIRCAGKRSNEDETIRRLMRKWKAATDTDTPLSSAMRRGMCVGTLRSSVLQKSKLVVVTGLPKAFDRSCDAICAGLPTTSRNLSNATKEGPVSVCTLCYLEQ